MVKHPSIGPRIARRGLLKSAAVGAAAVSAPSLLSFRALAQDAYEVNMQLGWLASNGLTGEIVADTMGYYAEEGVELSITPGGPGVDGVASVAAGRAQVGQLSSSPSLMLARSAGIPVTCIAAGYQQHPFTYFSLADNPIRTPEDMIGRTIATQPTAVILLRALLAQNNISEDDVEIVNMGADMNQLLTGQAQAVTGWSTNVNALSILGDGRVDLALWDAGIQLYANPYYVTDDTLANDFDGIASFLRGSARGWGYAYENPEEAVDMLVERYPNLDRDSEMAAMPLVLGFSFNEATAANGWGTMTRENWQAQISIYDQLGQFEDNPVPTVDEVMTLSVLEATVDTRPRIG